MGNSNSDSDSSGDEDGPADEGSNPVADAAHLSAVRAADRRPLPPGPVLRGLRGRLRLGLPLSELRGLGRDQRA